MKSFYILQSGVVKRSQNTLCIVDKKENKTYLPIEQIMDIFFLSEVSINTKALSFLAQKKIPAHFFNYYGFYSGSFYPREYLVSGFLLINQVKTHLDNERRLKIAKEFIRGAVHNTIKNLLYYRKYKKKVDLSLSALKQIYDSIDSCGSLHQLLALEGNSKEWYYKAFEQILGEDFALDKRTRRPPQSMINTLISFGNTLVYSTCLSQIYHTQLNPTISFLHSPGERRFSLSLDLAEVFKPILCDRVIFKLVNKAMISAKHFEKGSDFVFLNKRGREIFIQEYEKRLERTVHYQKMGKSVSYRHLVRLECYKLVKAMMEDEEYISFKSYW